MVVRVCNRLSLRDRKKAATRAALGAAAIKLGRLHGFDHVTAEAIAAEAGVSTRTFHNYFSSKEEAALHHLEESALEWVELLESRPVGEPFWDSVRTIVMQVIDDPDRDLSEIVAVAKMVEATPTLLGKKMEIDDSISDVMASAIADRLGMSAATDLYPRMLQSVLGAAVSSALALWESGNTSAGSVRELIEQALRQLEQGFLVPVPPLDPEHPVSAGQHAHA